MAKYFILMGDVIGSRGFDATKLRRQLKSLLSACNGDLKTEILSPYTTTLGDEFQGIAMSLHAAVTGPVKMSQDWRFKNVLYL